MTHRGGARPSRRLVGRSARRPGSDVRDDRLGLALHHPGDAASSSSRRRPERRERTVSWDFVTEAPREGMTAGGSSRPSRHRGDGVLMTLAAVPVGVATAIYLHEYSSTRSRPSARHPRRA